MKKKKKKENVPFVCHVSRGSVILLQRAPIYMPLYMCVRTYECAHSINICEHLCSRIPIVHNNCVSPRYVIVYCLFDRLVYLAR